MLRREAKARARGGVVSVWCKIKVGTRVGKCVV